MCDRISGSEFLDGYSEKTGLITAYCGICRGWDFMDDMQQKYRIGFPGLCRNRTDFCGNKYYYRGSCRDGGWMDYHVIRYSDEC